MKKNKLLILFFVIILAMPYKLSFANDYLNDSKDKDIQLVKDDDDSNDDDSYDDSDDDDSDDDDSYDDSDDDDSYDDSDDDDSDDDDSEIEIEMEDGRVKIEIKNQDGTKTEFEFENQREKLKFMSKRMYTEDELMKIKDVLKELEDESDDIGFIPVENIISKSLKFKFDTPPVIKSGRTLIPVRALSEAFGATVSWDESTQTITIEKDDMKMEINIGDNTALVNGESIDLDVPPEIMKGRTVVPLRFIVENMGLKIKWHENSRTIEIEDESNDLLDD